MMKKKGTKKMSGFTKASKKKNPFGKGGSALKKTGASKKRSKKSAKSMTMGEAMGKKAMPAGESEMKSYASSRGF